MLFEPRSEPQLNSRILKFAFSVVGIRRVRRHAERDCGLAHVDADRGHLLRAERMDTAAPFIETSSPILFQPWLFLIRCLSPASRRQPVLRFTGK